jgi:tetratricopeptide (TPR) repeat protein
MPLRFDDAPIPGVLSIDGYLMIDDRTPKQVAELILQRLNTSRSRSEVREESLDPAASTIHPLVVWNVPYGRNPFFTGREDTIVSLRARLESSGRAALSQALSGMGGIGKTQTALEYAYRYKDNYRAVMWIEADSEITIKTSLAAIGTALGLVAGDDQAHNQISEAIKQWCSTNKSWLLIFDNADKPQTLKQFLPLTPKGHILLTSRAQVLDAVGISKPLDVLEMTLDEAVEFLFARTGRISAEDEEKRAALTLAKELGCLPLALEQAAAFITAHQTPFSDYLRSYQKRQLELLGESWPVSGDYPLSVETTWAMNVAEIDTLSAAASDVLRVSAFLAPESIPIEIFISGGSELGEEVAKLAGQASDDPVMRDKLLEPLTRYSLIRRDILSHTYTIHRLVQAVIRQSLDDNHTRMWALRTTRALNKIFPSGSYDTWQQCERLLSHGVAVAALAQNFGFKESDAGDVVNSVACYLRMRGDFQEAERIHLQSVALRERDLGPNHPEVATCLNNLALVYTDRFEFATAEPLLERCLQIMKAAVGFDNPELSLALNNLGMCYLRSRKYIEAQPVLEQALALEQGTSEREDFFYATVLNNVAELKLGLESVEEAYHLCDEGLKIRERIGNPEKIGRSYITMASILARQDKRESAEEFFKKGLSNRENVFGTEHPELILTLRRYSQWLRLQDRAADAITFETRIYDICKRYNIKGDTA